MAVAPPRPRDLPLNGLRAFEAAARLRVPADLVGETCLTDASWAGDWAIWAAAAGMAGFAPRGPVFSLYALALAEAAGGAGVLIGHGSLVAVHIAWGEVVAPFGQRVVLPGGLRLWSARHLRAGSAVGRMAGFLRGV